MFRIAFFSLFSLALAAQNPPAAAEPQQENKVIGRVGSTVYRESDFYQYLPLIYQAAQLEQIKKSPELLQQAQKSFLESMVLANQARKEGVDKWPEFQSKLVGVVSTLMIQEYVNKNAPTLERLSTPSEEQLKAYYEENINDFKTQDRASARHILVSSRSDENDTDKPTDEEAKAKALKVKEELAGGLDWQKAAKDYSDDPGSKGNGGLYEKFNPSQMVTEFAEAVRTQEIGKVGEPVKTRYGYHIILVEERQMGEIQTFEEAKATINKQLGDKMRNETWAKWINSLKAELGYAEGEAAAPPPSKAAPSEAVGKGASGGKK